MTAASPTSYSRRHLPWLTHSLGVLQEGAPLPRRRAPQSPAGQLLGPSPGPSPVTWATPSSEWASIPPSVKGRKGFSHPHPSPFSIWVTRHAKLRRLHFLIYQWSHIFVHEMVAWVAANHTCCPSQPLPPQSGLVSPVPRGSLNPVTWSCTLLLREVSGSNARNFPVCPVLSPGVRLLSRPGS